MDEVALQNIRILDVYLHRPFPTNFGNNCSQLTIQFYDRTSIINPCLDSSVRFVEKLVWEVKQMHDEAGIPLDSYHFGGVRRMPLYWYSTSRYSTSTYSTYSYSTRSYST